MHPILADFPNGILWMSRNAIPAAEPQLSWAENPIHAALIVVCVFVLLCDIKDFFVIWSPLMPGLVRWKPLLDLEHNMQLARTRNRLAILLLIPVSLIIDWAQLIKLRLLFIIAIIAGFVLLRFMMSFIIPKKRIGQECWNAARHAMYSIFIVLSALMLLSIAVLVVLRVDRQTSAIVFYSEIGIAYLLSIIREGQILASQCGALRAFLYLCGLEILPAAAVACTAVFAI